MGLSKYLDAVRKITDHLENTQLPAIERAADLVIETMTNGGVVYCSDIGHGNQQDFMNRAGGLAAVQPFSYRLNIESPASDCLSNRPRSDAVETDLESVPVCHPKQQYAAGRCSTHKFRLRQGTGADRACACMPRYGHQGDRLYIDAVYVSGGVCASVRQEAFRGRGCNHRYRHPYGDAAVEMPGFEFNVLPVSGVSMICAGWMIWGRVMERMVEMGNPPTVFMSVNRPGGVEKYEESRRRFNEKGY